jgi:DNA-directed RNA polymerase specialized sigma24 family protein
MAIAADWEERFQDLVRVSPQDARAAWTLIAECLEDDEELSRTIRRAVRLRHLDEDDCDDVCQQVALSLLRVFRLHPELGLARRHRGVAPRAWLRGMVRKLVRKVIDRFRRKRHATASLAGLDCESADADGAHEHGELDMLATAIFKASRKNQQAHDDAVDFAIDLKCGLALCSAQTARVLAAYCKDQHVQTVADESGMSYCAAWSALQRAKV